jgi:endoglucanase
MLAFLTGPSLDLGDRLVAKSMDDRIGAAVLVETLRQVKKPHQLFFVFSTQEEVGLRAQPRPMGSTRPGVSVDVTGTEIPAPAKVRMSQLGKGSGCQSARWGMLSDRRVVDGGARAKLGLPYQLEVLEGGTTDARHAAHPEQVSPQLSFHPCRYVHSPSEMVDFKRQNGVRLLVELVSTR